MEPTWREPEDWQKDGTIISGVSNLKTGAWTQILTAKETLGGRTIDVIIKTFVIPGGGDVGSELSDPDRITMERDRFLAAARLQRDLNEHNAQAWVKVLKISEDPRQPSFSMEKCGPSLQDLLEHHAHLSAKDFYHIVHSVLQGLIELKERHNRSHGTLKTSNILAAAPGDHPRYKLADPAAKGEDHSANDLYSLGLLLVQLVEHKEYDPLTQLLPTKNWERFGSRRDRWIQFCNLLLSPNGCHETLRNVKKEALRLKPASPLRPVLAGVGIVGLVAVGALGYHLLIGRYRAAGGPVTPVVQIDPQVKSTYDQAHQRYQDARAHWIALTPTTRYDHTPSRTVAREARTLLPDQVVLTDADSYRTAADAYGKAAGALEQATTQVAAEEQAGQQQDAAAAADMARAQSDFVNLKARWDATVAKFTAGRDHTRSSALAQAAVALVPAANPTDPTMFAMTAGEYRSAIAKLNDALGLVPEEEQSGAGQDQVMAAFTAARKVYQQARDQWAAADLTKDIDLAQPRALADKAKASIPEEIILTDSASYRSAADRYTKAAQQLQQAVALVESLKKSKPPEQTEVTIAVSNANQALRDKKYGDALTWYRKAADLGSAPAMRNVGLLYEMGQGAEQDMAQAVAWYRKAADQNYAPAMCDLALLYQKGQGLPRDVGQAVVWLRKAADLQSAPAMRSLGSLYENGRGVAQSYGDAMMWYRKAAELGDATAVTNIGVFYERGYGVKADAAQALDWYRRAADLNSAAAMNDIGSLYDNGRGVKTNYAEALKWYQKAADLGYVPAMCNIGSLYDNGLGVPMSHDQAMVWFRKAADLGSGMAMYDIGVIYENGRGVNPNRAEAVGWYRKAAKADDEDAQTLAIQALDRIAAAK